MKNSTRVILSILHVVSWIIFIGLCIKTGTIIISAIVSLAGNPVAAKNLYLGLDLSGMYNFSIEHYVSVVSLIAVVTAMKAHMFYVVPKVFPKINLVHPFSVEVSKLISRISYIAMMIGIFMLIGNGYCEWLIKRGANLPHLDAYLGAGGEFLLFAGVIFIIAQVFKKGIEIQSENELTI